MQITSCSVHTIWVKSHNHVHDQETNSEVKYILQGYVARTAQSLDLNRDLPDPKIHALKHYENDPPNLIKKKNTNSIVKGFLCVCKTQICKFGTRCIVLRFKIHVSMVGVLNCFTMKKRNLGSPGGSAV